MKKIYWNSDTDVMVMPTGLLDLKKITALDPRIKTVSNDNGMDVVSCGYYGTCAAVLNDIDYNPKATDSHVVECWYKKDHTKIPSIVLYDQPMVIEKGNILPKEIEEFFRKYCD